MTKKSFANSKKINKARVHGDMNSFTISVNKPVFILRISFTMSWFICYLSSLFKLYLYNYSIPSRGNMEFFSAILIRNLFCFNCHFNVGLEESQWCLQCWHFNPSQQSSQSFQLLGQCLLSYTLLLDLDGSPAMYLLLFWVNMITLWCQQSVILIDLCLVTIL